jgi:predicted transcriptional regulator
MRKRYSPGEKEKIILDYIKNNPNATHRSIKKDTKLHVGRVFKSLKEAFEKAKIEPPRNFDIKTYKQKRKIIIDYIRKNPATGGHTIAKDTKINVSSAFQNIEEAYKLAGIEYVRKEYVKLKKRSKKEREKMIIEAIRKNPLISITEIMNKAKCQPYRIFKNIDEAYTKAGVKNIEGHNKRTIKKQEEIISFIKKNPLATQREINKNCKTHVQTIFDRGIFEAYEKANVEFPFERLKKYGVGLKEIRDRAKTFEEEISIKLSGFGKVNRLVKTKRGFADIIFERKGKKAIIEIKDYQNKDISISQIKQLKKYLEDCNCNLGILICRNKPKKDRFLIDKNKIFVLDEFELTQIPTLLTGQ